MYRRLSSSRAIAPFILPFHQPYQSAPTKRAAFMLTPSCKFLTLINTKLPFPTHHHNQSIRYTVDRTSNRNIERAARPEGDRRVKKKTEKNLFMRPIKSRSDNSATILNHFKEFSDEFTDYTRYNGPRPTLPQFSSLLANVLVFGTCWSSAAIRREFVIIFLPLFTGIITAPLPVYLENEYRASFAFWGERSKMYINSNSGNAAGRLSLFLSNTFTNSPAHVTQAVRVVFFYYFFLSFDFSPAVVIFRQFGFRRRRVMWPARQRLLVSKSDAKFSSFLRIRRVIPTSTMFGLYFIA